METLTYLGILESMESWVELALPFAWQCKRTMTTAFPKLQSASSRTIFRVFLLCFMLNLTQMNCLRALSRIAPQPFGLRWGGRSLTLRHCSTTSISTDPPSQTERVRPNIADNEFQALGLSTDILEALSAQGIKKPTPVQKSVIPRLLANENIVMAASTGSGKTLAYLLPAIEAMHNDELLGYQRQMKRPRCLILVPTRDLARQVLQATKSVGHYAKVSSAAVLGGEQYALQKKALDRVVDLVVASPGRLMQHKEQGNVFLSHVHTVIIDEVDTMLTQGFGSDLRAILRSVLARKEGPEGLRPSFQLIMATATLTKSVKALLQEVQSENGGAFDINYTDPSNPTPRKASPNKTTTAVEMKIVEVDGVHRSLPNVRHRFELTRGKDKLSLLKEILHASTGKNKNERILVFCNTVQSSRAVEYAINEDPAFHAVSYHGELNSREREKNLDDFRSGDEKLLVCTDLAARGLDIPDINHVVLFDFPLNPVDYLHRAGRCGRAGRAGKVTSLVSKRDEVLARAIELAIQRKEPIDALSSSKSSYAVTPTKTRKSFLDGVPRPRPKKTIIGSRGAPAGGRGGARGGKVATGGAKAGLRTERGKGEQREAMTAFLLEQVVREEAMTAFLLEQVVREEAMTAFLLEQVVREEVILAAFHQEQVVREEVILAAFLLEQVVREEAILTAFLQEEVAREEVMTLRADQVDQREMMMMLLLELVARGAEENFLRKAVL
eukprot:gene9169-10122_t